MGCIVDDGRQAQTRRPADDDLVVGGRMAKDVAGAAAFSPVAPVAVTLDGILDEVNVALESIEFVVVHGGLSSLG